MFNHKPLLENKTVLVTRPKQQSHHLCHLIETAKGTAISFPTLDIYPVKNMKLLCESMKNIEKCDLGIFVSANAVNYAIPFWNVHHPKILIAIGPATQCALKKHGFKEVIIPSQYHSEGLLELPLLKNPSQRKIAILCGEHTRPLLAETLRKRGALVTQAECYRRQCPQITPDELAALRSQSVSAIVSTSLESLQNLYALFVPFELSWLLSLPLVVISEPMKHLAQRLNFKHIQIASSPTDKDIIQALLLLYNERDVSYA